MGMKVPNSQSCYDNTAWYILDAQHEFASTIDTINPPFLSVVHVGLRFSCFSSQRVHERQVGPIKPAPMCSSDFLPACTYIRWCPECLAGFCS